MQTKVTCFKWTLDVHACNRGVTFSDSRTSFTQTRVAQQCGVMHVRGICQKGTTGIQTDALVVMLSTQWIVRSMQGLLHVITTTIFVLKGQMYKSGLHAHKNNIDG